MSTARSIRAARRASRWQPEPDAHDFSVFPEPPRLILTTKQQVQYAEQMQHDEVAAHRGMQMPEDGDDFDYLTGEFR